MSIPERQTSKFSITSDPDDYGFEEKKVTEEVDDYGFGTVQKPASQLASKQTSPTPESQNQAHIDAIPQIIADAKAATSKTSQPQDDWPDTTETSDKQKQAEVDEWYSVEDEEEIKPIEKEQSTEKTPEEVDDSDAAKVSERPLRQRTPPPLINDKLPPPRFMVDKKSSQTVIKAGPCLIQAKAEIKAEAVLTTAKDEYGFEVKPVQAAVPVANEEDEYGFNSAPSKTDNSSDNYGF